ncbi:MAG: glutathione S-transferase family protein, partial [Burkholderia sp.]|nr:glutathione S-transferase family protein [Burkholderia sp.]
AATGNCLRAVMALEEAGIPYRLRHLDLAGGEHKRKPYTDLNPAGVVPTIVDQGADGARLVLTQSNAIVLYAASKAPGRLMPVTEGPERAVVLERFFFFVTDVIVPSGAGFFLGRNQQADAAALLDGRMRDALIGAERYAAASRFIAGDDFSVADIAGFTITGFAKARLPWDRLPNLALWFDLVKSRPGVQRAYQALGMAQPG